MNLNVLATVILAAAASGGGKNADGTVTPYTLQDAATATGNGDYVAVNAGVGTTFVLDVTITDTATITVEVSNDNSSWQTIGAVRLTTGAIVSTITASGGYQVPASGWNYLRARISAYTSGSVTVKVQRSLFALVFKSSTVASSDMPDPYVPVDGTMNVTGGITATGTIAGAAITLASADIPDPYTPTDGTWNVTGNINVTTRVTAGNGAAAGLAAQYVLTDNLAAYTGGSVPLSIDNGNGARFTNTTPVVCNVQSVSQSGAATLTPTSCYVEIDCSNAGGCAQTFSEASAIEGQIVIIKNLASSTGAVTIADSAGVQMVAGASISLGDDDHVEFVYDGTQWDQHTAVLAIE